MPPFPIPPLGKLLHDERHLPGGIWPRPEAATEDTDVVIGDWRLTRSPDGKFHAQAVSGKDFSLDLSFAPTQPVLLEGENGYSQKGPKPDEASDYYSIPHLTRVRNPDRGMARPKLFQDRPGSIANGHRTISIRRPRAGIG